MNIAIQSGNITRDAEVKTYEKGSWITFSIAVKKDPRDVKEDDKHDAYFRNVRYWVNSTTPKVQNFLVKGARVVVQGEWKSSRYEKDGQTKYFEEINAREVEILRYADSPAGVGASDEAEGDLPF